MSYKGWTNRITWIISLWATADDGVTSIAERRQSPADLEVWVRRQIEEDELSCAIPPFLSNLLHAGLDDVNWQEVWEYLRSQEIQDD